MQNWHYTIQGESKGYPYGGFPDGHTDARWNKTFAMPYLFTGRYSDPMSNLTHMDARWYSADIQRFLQPDYYNIAQLQTPMASRHLLLAKSGLTRQDLMMDPSQQMRYGYVGGNQLGKLDWNGLFELFTSNGDGTQNINFLGKISEAIGLGQVNVAETSSSVVDKVQVTDASVKAIESNPTLNTLPTTGQAMSDPVGALPAGEYGIAAGFGLAGTLDITTNGDDIDSVELKLGKGYGADVTFFPEQATVGFGNQSSQSGLVITLFEASGCISGLCTKAGCSVNPTETGSANFNGTAATGFGTGGFAMGASVGYRWVCEQ